jgi:cytochrome c peroxidase
MHPAARPSNTGPRPCAALWQHAPYFHNGAALTLDAVVQAYNTKRALGLTADQIADLVQYLKSL